MKLPTIAEEIALRKAARPRARGERKRRCDSTRPGDDQFGSMPLEEQHRICRMHIARAEGRLAELRKADAAIRKECLAKGIVLAHEL